MVNQKLYKQLFVLVLLMYEITNTQSDYFEIHIVDGIPDAPPALQPKYPFIEPHMKNGTH